MRALFSFIFVMMFFGESFSEVGTYKAGVIERIDNNPETSFSEIIEKAGNLKIDILLFPFTEGKVKRSILNYDEMIKTISKAVKQARLYVITQLPNKVVCENQYEEFMNIVVFGRDGSLVAVKPTEVISKCNSTMPRKEFISFNTDFGTSFTIIYTEDLVLHHPETLARNVKNFVMAGNWESELPFLTSNQMLSTFAQFTESNVLIGSGIHCGNEVKTVPLDSTTKILLADLKNEPTTGKSTHLPYFTKSKAVHHEDMSQYTTRPLDLSATARGYEDTVCHREFCCQFYIKTRDLGSNQYSSKYSLAVFEGVRPFGLNNRISVQNCAVFAVSETSRHSCVIGSNNSSANNLIFDEITVSANFSKENSCQFPTTLTSAILPLQPNEYTFDGKIVNNIRQVTVKLSAPGNLKTFGIFGRDFSEKNENPENIETGFSADLNDFFDYVCIRLRILIFVVSIYFLEMM